MKIAKIINLVNGIWNIAVDIPQFDYFLNEARFQRMREKVFETREALEQLDERMRVRTITEDKSTWPEVGIHVLLYTNFSGYKEAWREGDIWISRNAMASVCTEHVINHHGTWQYLPDWSEG